MPTSTLSLTQRRHCISVVFTAVVLFAISTQTSAQSFPGFTGPFIASPNFTFGSLKEIAVSDFDSNGTVDLAAFSQSEVRILFGDGVGALNSSASTPFFSSSMQIAAQVNIGNSPDLIAKRSPGPGNKIALLLNNGMGVFNTSNDLLTFGTISGFAVGNFNNDSFLDIAVSDNVSGLTLRVGDGAGNFISPSTLSNAPTGQLLAADLDGDGLDDIVGLGSSLFVVLTQSPGTLPSQITSTLFSTSSSLLTKDVAVADLNNDGHLDIVATESAGTSEAHIFYGDGAGAFPVSETISIGATNDFLRLADMNYDGSIDLVLATDNATNVNNIKIIFNNGTGSFQNSTEFLLSEPLAIINDIEIIDFDNDTDMDIVVATLNGNISLFLNNRVLNVPSAFGLEVPANGDQSVSLRPYLTWSVSTGPEVIYTVEIATNNTFTPTSNNTFIQTNLLNNYILLPVSTLRSSTNYFWRVTANNPVGDTVSSSVFSFQTSNPADINGDGLVNGADLAILLSSWTG